MKDEAKNQIEPTPIGRAQATALRRLAGLLDAVASLIDGSRADSLENAEKFVASPRAATTQPEPLDPTRKMPAMEQQALALDEAVRGVARAIGDLEPQDRMRERIGPDEIPLPEAPTKKMSRPEQMMELMQKLHGPPEMPLPPGSIVEVEPLAPTTRKMGSRTSSPEGTPPGVRNPQSFGRSHPK